MDERLKLEMDPYHRPSFCSKCGGVMVFGGVGEYHCEDCKNIEYDDFGKVRLFIEQNRGATAVQIEESTGVKQKTIRQMLRENRLEITTGSHAFLHCEICGANIRSGRFCDSCEKAYHEHLEEQNRKRRNIAGFGMDRKQENEGAKRFIRDNE